MPFAFPDGSHRLERTRTLNSLEERKVTTGGSRSVFIGTRVYRGHADEDFWFMVTWSTSAMPAPLGANLTINADVHPVRLRSGGWAYIDPNTGGSDGAHISWYRGRILYSFGRALSDKSLERVAQSLVCTSRG